MQQYTGTPGSTPKGLTIEVYRELDIYGRSFIIYLALRVQSRIIIELPIIAIKLPVIVIFYLRGAFVQGAWKEVRRDIPFPRIKIRKRSIAQPNVIRYLAPA